MPNQASWRFRAVGLAAVAVCVAALALAALWYHGQRGPLAGGMALGTDIVAKGALLGVDEAQMNLSAMEKARAYGIGWVRTDVSLSPAFQSYMDNISASGLHLVGILDYDTLGVRVSSNGCMAGCNWTLAQWNGSVANAVDEYPYVHVWEIWNEPQIQRYQSGFYNGSPYNYFLMLRSAYSIIKSHNESDTVLCLGGANLYYGGLQPATSDLQWTQQLWAYGASQYCDAISLHIYSAFTYLLNQTPSYDGETGGQTIGQMFNSTLSQYESLTGKPLWVTETGIPSGINDSYQDPYAASTVKQKEYLDQVFSLLLSKPYTKAVFWYDLYGLNSPPYDIDFGLLYPNMTPKPAYYAYNAIALELGGGTNSS